MLLLTLLADPSAVRGCNANAGREVVGAHCPLPSANGTIAVTTTTRTATASLIMAGRSSPCQWHASPGPTRR